MTKLKNILYSGFQKVTRRLWGTGIGKIPGLYALHGWLFRILQPSERVIEVQGSKMYVNPDKLPASYQKTFQSYMVSGVWEELTTDIFKKVVKAGDIIVDMGANIGYFTLLAARLTGKDGKVYAFEPEPHNFALLSRNIELNGYDNVVAMQKAVSDKNGKIKLFVNKNDTGAHSLYQPENAGESIEIEAVTMDDFFKDKNRHVDVIKMDIEGAELDAFAGLQQIIRENTGLKMFVEFHLPALDRNGISPAEFFSRIQEDYRFTILAIADYAKNKQYVKVNNAEELINLSKNSQTINLFLEKAQSG